MSTTFTCATEFYSPHCGTRESPFGTLEVAAAVAVYRIPLPWAALSRPVEKRTTCGGTMRRRPARSGLLLLVRQVQAQLALRRAEISTSSTSATSHHRVRWLSII